MTKYFLTFFLLFIFLFSCQKEDPCDNTVCQIGNCSDGVCVCPNGYMGDDCGIQVTPTKILVSAIRVLEFPETKENGDPWDISNGPDLVLTITKDNNEYWTSSVSFTDAEYGEVYSFGSIPPLEITDVEAIFQLGLFDLDGSDSEQMGSYFFEFYSSNNEFPVHPILGTPPLVFEFDLEYEW